MYYIINMKTKKTKVMGRPLKYGEPTGNISLRMPVSRIKSIPGNTITKKRIWILDMVFSALDNLRK